MLCKQKLYFYLLIVILNIFFIPPTKLKAQNRSNPFITLINRTILADNGDLISVDVKITNAQLDSLKGKLIITIDENLELVSKPQIEIFQSPTEIDYYEYKILVPKKAPALENLEFKIELVDSNNKVVESAIGNISVNQTKNVSLYALENTMQIRNIGEILSIPIRIVNAGNTDQNITIISKFPPLRSNEEESYVTENVFLKAFVDTTIIIKRVVYAKMLSIGDFEITISCIYENGDIAGIGSTTIQSLNSRKVFQSNIYEVNPFYNSIKPNTIEVGTQFLFNNFETYIVRAAGDIAFSGKDSKLSYSIDGQFWKNTMSRSFFRNTFLSYEKKNKGVTIGNISRNFDINLIGRGVSGFIQTTDKKTSLEAGWIDESFNLFEKNNYVGFDNGKAWWVNLKIDKNRKGLNSAIIRQKNPIFNEDHLLFTNQLSLEVSKKVNITGFANAAYSKTVVGDFSKFSYASGFNIDGKFDKILLVSENYHSSPFYPGIKRGSTIFSQRLTFLGNKNNISAEYTYNSIIPKFINIPNAGGTSIKTHKADLGISGQLTERVSYAFNANYYQENNKMPNGLNTFLEAEIKSISSNIRLNYFNFKRKRYFYFNADAGFYKSPLTDGNKTLFHFKTNSTIQFGIFSLNIFTQEGEFYSGEIFTKSFQNIKKLSFFNITPLLQSNFFKNKLHLEAGVTFIRSNLNSNGSQVTGRADYNFNLTDKIYMSYQKYQYDFNQYSLSDFRIGLIKQLPSLNIHSDRHNLSLMVFKDLNGNNKFDINDSIATDYIIKVNKDVLISDAKGKAIFKKLPKGSYSISVPPAKGWYATEKQISLTESKSIIIALERNAVLKGSISYLTETFTSYEVEKKLEGILIKATDKYGFEYKTKSRESGNFIFFLPPGEYIVEINPGDLPDKIECRSCKENLLVETNSAAFVRFKLAVQEQKFKIQKFISNGIKN